MTARRDLQASQASGVGSEFSQTDSAVYMRFGANGASRCRMVSDDASNPSIMSMGDEGVA